MQSRLAHPSDQELLLFADRQASPRMADRIREHLAQCAPCQVRVSALESTMADFVSLHEERVASMVKAPSAARAALQARLAEARRPGRDAPSWLLVAVLTRQMAAACVALLIVVASLWAVRSIDMRRSIADSPDQLAYALPSKKLTPGATRSVRLDELCKEPASDGPLPVDASLEQRVFSQYGLSTSSRQAYELDYLITPELGGSTDIQNLWPEPYAATSWNAHVKDQLEDHLHELVCQGKLPLSTAQNEIATNWIAAYKQHFHTEKPLTNAAVLTLTADSSSQQVHRRVLNTETPNM